MTCVHKANILKLSDGLFLRTCRRVAEEFSDIPFDDSIIDAAAAVGYYARFNERGRFEWGPEPDRGDLDPVASFGDGPGGLDDVNAVVTSREE